MATKTKDSIRKKWDKKSSEMKKKADFKYSIILQNRRKHFDENWEYEVAKVERKKASYIRKKEEEYRRKCANEIREFE